MERSVALVSTRLRELETVIERGLQTYIDVGNALLEIREGRLYRETHATFEEYCLGKWGWGIRRAQQLMQAADVAQSLVPDANHGSPLPPPGSERVARELARIAEPEQRQAVWQEVTVQYGDQPTAADVRTIAVEYVARKDAGDQAVRTIVVEQVAHKDAGDRADLYVRPVDPGKASNTTFNRTNDLVDWAWWTWNPVTGCLHNCPYCYARDIANRFYPTKFAPTFLPERLAAPANTKVPVSDDPRSRRVFTCSMADLFGKWVPQEWIDAVFAQVRDNPQWTFLFLTKFPQRMAELDWPDNAWVGTSVDRQYRVPIAERAFEHLKAGVKWLSCEPMLEPLTFSRLDLFDWVVVGGQSKSTQEPAFYPPWEWIEDLLGQARAAGCRVYMKPNLIAPDGTNLAKEEPQE